VFYLHSRLLERAAQLSSEKGGGSLTAIPVVETQEGDVSAYIPTNIISITDGQIFLESGLFHQGIRPAVNVGLSVSRVGSAAQTAAMKKVSASLKLELAQYREVLSFAQLSSDLDATTQALLNRGARLTAVMKQKPYRPLTMAQEVVSLFVGTHGFLDDISIGEIEAFQQGLLDTLRLQGADILTAIETTGDLSDETVQKLTQFIQKYTESYQSKADMIADDKVGRAI
jgi:F-type H+-transporting ATPase subunit alpha